MILCAGADVKALSHLAAGHVGGENLPIGPEHSAASDSGLRNPRLHCGAHNGSRHEFW